MRSERLLGVRCSSSGSLGGGLARHLRNVLFHPVVSSPPSFCRPRAVRKVRPPSIDVGSPHATPLPPVSPPAATPSWSRHPVAKVQQDDREKSSRIGREENGPAMAMRATSRPLGYQFLRPDPAMPVVHGHAHTYTCVYACSYISTRAYTRGITHARRRCARMHHAPRVAAVSRPLTRTYARTHAWTHARTDMGALGRRW